MAELKRSDDLVRIINITEQDGNPREELRLTYDGANYDISTEKVVTRIVAEHLVKKAHLFTERRHRLKIVELPVSQRQKSPGEFPALAEANKSLEVENAELRARLAELEKKKK